MTPDPRSVASIMEDTRRLLTSGNLSKAERDDAEAFIRDMSEHSATDIAAYDFFLAHMPADDADISLIILKGHLLVEQRVREFVGNRLLTPQALSAARLTSHQWICLAEAMCLPNPEPAWLWATVRELNGLRNSLAHNLAPTGIQERIDKFLTSYRGLHSIRGGLVSCIGNLYARVAALAELALEKDYRIPRSQ
jgi:hypothetical protein